MEKVAKKKYKKPSFKEVDLTPLDAVLANCKTVSTGRTTRCYVSAASTCATRTYGS